MQPSPTQPEPSADTVTDVRADNQTETLLGGLDDLGGRPLTEHVEVFEQIHGRLQAALRDIDNA